MRNEFPLYAIIAMLATVTVFTSCDTATQKVDTAKVKVDDAKQDLKEAQQDASVEAQKKAKAEEWQAFKDQTTIKINENETVIADLKTKMKKSGKALDAAYAKNIEMLEQKNSAMRDKMNAYQNSQSDWETFKREFNHDMDGLGQAIRDLAVNNKK